MEFTVIFSQLTNKLHLKSNIGHCHSLESIERLLESKNFHRFNSSLVPYFEKGKLMMLKGEVGKVELLTF